MPPSRNTTANRKPPAFKPPRPKAKPNSNQTAPPPSRRKSAPSSRPSARSSPPAVDSQDEDENGPEPSASPRQPLPPTEDASPTIPSKLLTKLLHTHFSDDGMRIGKEANAAVGKYFETFVREAIARAAFERAEAVGSAGGSGDGFLEMWADVAVVWGGQVEDLEKLAPQLLLDF